MVAWHEMPGKRANMIRPVGKGVILGGAGCSSRTIIERPAQPDHTVPYGTGLSTTRYQAFHARLPSFHPSGIRVLPNCSLAIQRANKHNTHVAKFRRAFTKEAFPSRFRLREMLPDFCRMIRSHAVLR
jgi:hypothetical protein